MSRRRAALAASPSVLKMSEEDEAAEEYEGPAAEVEVVTTDRRKDAGVLAATGATGAIVGWSLGHSLGLDMMGMFAGMFLFFFLHYSYLQKGDVLSHIKYKPCSL